MDLRLVRCTLLCDSCRLDGGVTPAGSGGEMGERLHVCPKLEAGTSGVGKECQLISSYAMAAPLTLAWTNVLPAAVPGKLKTFSGSTWPKKLGRPEDSPDRPLSPRHQLGAAAAGFSAACLLLWCPAAAASGSAFDNLTSLPLQMTQQMERSCAPNECGVNTARGNFPLAAISANSAMDRILAEQLARRFREMDEVELIRVLEQMLQAQREAPPLLVSPEPKATEPPDAGTAIAPESLAASSPEAAGTAPDVAASTAAAAEKPPDASRTGNANNGAPKAAAAAGGGLMLSSRELIGGALDGLDGKMDGKYGALDGLDGRIDGKSRIVDGFDVLDGSLDGRFGVLDTLDLLDGRIDGNLGALDAFDGKIDGKFDPVNGLVEKGASIVKAQGLGDAFGTATAAAMGSDVAASAVSAVTGVASGLVQAPAGVAAAVGGLALGFMMLTRAFSSQRDGGEKKSEEEGGSMSSNGAMRQAEGRQGDGGGLLSSKAAMRSGGLLREGMVNSFGEVRTDSRGIGVEAKEARDGDSDVSEKASMRVSSNTWSKDSSSNGRSSSSNRNSNSRGSSGVGSEGNSSSSGSNSGGIENWRRVLGGGSNSLSSLIVNMFQPKQGELEGQQEQEGEEKMREQRNGVGAPAARVTGLDGGSNRMGMDGDESTSREMVSGSGGLMSQAVASVSSSGTAAGRERERSEALSRWQRRVKVEDEDLWWEGRGGEERRGVEREEQGWRAGGASLQSRTNSLLNGAAPLVADAADASVQNAEAPRQEAATVSSGFGDVSGGRPQERLQTPSLRGVSEAQVMSGVQRDPRASSSQQAFKRIAREREGATGSSFPSSAGQGFSFMMKPNGGGFGSQVEYQTAEDWMSSSRPKSREKVFTASRPKSNMGTQATPTRQSYSNVVNKISSSTRPKTSQEGKELDFFEHKGQTWVRGEDGLFVPKVDKLE